MPDREKSTLLKPAAITPEEADAREILGNARELLANVKRHLEGAYELLPDPPDSEAMGEGTVPESLTFSLRGSIECALSDHVNPLLDLLKRALKETPARLIREWQRRQRKARVN